MDPAIAQSPFTTPVEVHLVALLVDQLGQWKACLSSLLAYFQEVSQIESQSLAAHNRLAMALMEAVPINSNGLDSALGSPRASLSQQQRNNAWLAPLQSVALKASSASEAYVAFLREQTLLELATLQNDFKRASRAIRDKLSLAQRDLLRYLQALNKARQEAQAGGECRWLISQRLRLAASSYLAEKERFLASLQGLYREGEQLVGLTGAKAAALASEALLVRGKQTTLLAEQLSEGSVRLQAIDGAFEWLQALIKHGLDYEWNLNAPPLDAFLLHVVEGAETTKGSNEEKEQNGEICRQGMLQMKTGAFRQWSPFWWILTDTGHLHAFTPPSNASHFSFVGEPVQSWDLRGAVVTGAPNGHDLSILLPAQAGIFGRGERKYTLRCQADTEMVEWLLAIRSVQDGLKDEKSYEKPHEKKTESRSQSTDVEESAHELDRSLVCEGDLADGNSADELERKLFNAPPPPPPDLDNPWT